MSAVLDDTASRTLTVALIGNPNTGKSTLFNALAGMRAHVGNYPGVTVEKKIGRLRCEGHNVTLVDLPGTYSLSPRTLDEMVSVNVLLGKQPDVGRPDAVICIVDAANLERNLYLVSQVLDLNLPTILVLNMSDVAAARGMTIDVEALRDRLGVAVVQTEAHRRRGLDELRQAIVEIAQSDPVRPPRLFPEPFYRECDALAERIGSEGREEIPMYILERMLLDIGGAVEAHYTEHAGKRSPAFSEKPGFSQGGLSRFLAEARERLRENGCRIPAVEAQVRYGWARQTLEGVLTRPQEQVATTSDKIDRILTHRIAGLFIFAALMFVVFLSIYQWAEPFMGAIESAQDFVAGAITSSLAPGAFRSLLVDGVVAGVGGVIVFVPQIAFLFFFIALMEDCGYMARAAFLMDKLMTRVGLSGKSFVPLMSSFACAIPGVMATRVIENRRDRMVTILVAPLMSCSARLPVYLLMIALFIPDDRNFLRAGVLFGMYSVGILVAIPVAWILKKTLFRGETPPFVMELPTYKWPSPGLVLHRVYDRSKAFVVRAGTLIFATTVIVWACGYFPGDHGELNAVTAEIEQLQAQTNPDEERLAQLSERANQLSARLIEGSILGRTGHAIEPAVRPLGWDWKIGVGVIASFPAREVIIATLGTIYSLGGDVDEGSANLSETLQAERWPDGSPIYTVPVAISIMIFFALCAQCAATLMVIRRETNSWFWPAFTFAYMTGLAYLGALATYQIGTMFV